jgi:hypothetical protein
VIWCSHSYLTKEGALAGTSAETITIVPDPTQLRLLGLETTNERITAVCVRVKEISG